jgi:hypothetical protein
MDYLGGGELFFHLRRRGLILEKEARFYFGEMVLGIEFLHGVRREADTATTTDTTTTTITTTITIVVVVVVDGSAATAIGGGAAIIISIGNSQ